VAALGTALAHLGLDSDISSLPGRSDNTLRFDPGERFVNAPSVTRVAVPMSDRSMMTGFVVTTWTRAGNLLYETLVDGHGRVLSSVLRTNTVYNIFEEPRRQPAVEARGWCRHGNPRRLVVAGDQSTVEIDGNNVHAYLDTENDSVPDGTGSTVTGGNFLSIADLTDSPGIQQNQAVSVQNLFYHNNLIHDILYRAGFDEAAANFQEEIRHQSPRRR
jgi:hypothetical protein